MADPRADLLQKVLAEFGEDLSEHERRVADYDRRYRSYRAVVEKPADDWMPKFHPAYVFQSVETMVANLVDPNPRWRIRVYPQLGEQMAELQQGARANELLLRQQLNLDHWAEKQRPFDLQGLICGITASKQFWNYREGPRRSQRFTDRPLLNLFGRVIGRVPEREDVVETVTLRDDPTSEVVDVRFLVFQKGAVSLPRSERITHQVFYSFEQLKRQACRVNNGRFHDGPCEPGRYYHNVDELRNEQGVPGERFSRENELFGTRPHHDGIEVLEQWRREGDSVRVVCVGQRKTLLADRQHPFWLDHLEHPFPFVVCSGAPDLFAIPGISEVEVMAELQELLWTVGKQRLANVELVNNAIKLVAEDAEDIDQFERHAAGETWLVPRPIKETVDLWAPDITAARVSLEAEALLKGDLQNVTGGMPFLSGTQTQGIDQQTATGVSIVTSLAQKRLAAKRQQFIWAKARIGEQWTALNQQFVREPRLVPVIGADGAEAFEEIRPELLQGLYLFETEIADESMMRQEKRAEAQAKLQTVLQGAAVSAAAGTPLNVRAAWEDYLEAYGITDTERYFASQSQPRLPGQPPQAGANGSGVTNPELAAGILAPSNETTMSPEAAMQQFLAGQGRQS